MTELAISQSLTGAIWQFEDSMVADEAMLRISAYLSQDYDMPLPIAQWLAKKGIDADSIEQFLEPRLRDLLPDPSSFQDMDKACEILADAIIAGKPVGIFGDYDVDGASSAAIFSRFLAAFGITAHIHIPDRFKEGYGPNMSALQSLQKAGAELLITVDCGITAHRPLADAANAGMKIIVIDHHQAAAELPQALAVVNPNRLDDTSGQGALCAASMVFMTCVGTLRLLRQKNAFPDDKAPIDLLSLLDLVAMATICDIVPLTSVNRAFVKQGLKIFKQRQNVGLRQLSDQARLNKPPTAQTFGFVIGPRINAGGRIGNAALGAQLLSTNDEGVAAAIAIQLDDLNKQRRDIEADIKRVAVDAAETKLATNPDLPVLILASDDWHEGVLGIVAGRLKDQFNRPTIIISFDDEGNGKGSARGIPGFQLGDAIMAAHQAGILTGGGGHAMAAGLSLKKDRLADFEAFMCERFTVQIGKIPKPSLRLSQMINLSQCNHNLLEWLEKCEPFGSAFPAPRLLIENCQLRNIRWLGADNNHFSAELFDGTGAKIRAIAFSFKDRLIDKNCFTQADGRMVHVAGIIKADDYRGGNAVQFHIDDIAFANSSAK